MEMEINADGDQVKKQNPRRYWIQCGITKAVHTMLTERSFDFEKYERGPTNSGPARQVFSKPFLIVTSTTTTQLPHYLSMYVANMHMVAASTYVNIVNDYDIVGGRSSGGSGRGGGGGGSGGGGGGGGDNSNLTVDFQSQNMIIIGRDNALWQEYLEEPVRPPVERLPNGFRVGPCVFNQSGTGLIFLAPHWDAVSNASRLRLYIVGNDDEGLRAAGRLVIPTIPPMLRAPLSNQIPDFVVVSKNVLQRGAGGILASGSWNYDWSFSREASYWQC